MLTFVGSQQNFLCKSKHCCILCGEKEDCLTQRVIRTKVSVFCVITTHSPLVWAVNVFIGLPDFSKFYRFQTKDCKSWLRPVLLIFPTHTLHFKKKKLKNTTKQLCFIHCYRSRSRVLADDAEIAMVQCELWTLDTLLPPSH